MSLFPDMGSTPEQRPHADLEVKGSRDQVRSTRAYIEELLAQEQARRAATNGSIGETERFLAEYLRAFDESEARLSRPSVPRSGRRFLPMEVRAARQKLYAIGGVMLALWLMAIFSPFVARGLG